MDTAKLPEPPPPRLRKPATLAKLSFEERRQFFLRWLERSPVKLGDPIGDNEN